MISILLDSSNTDLYVGLMNEDGVIDSTFYECWQMQSEYMIVELDKLLSKNGFSRESIKDVVVSIGPGSYTGVRIAITIAKIIGVALNCKVYPVSSLRILADYNRQLCECGHSITFMPKTKYLICHYCGRKVINKTKGHFMKEMYKALNESK